MTALETKDEMAARMDSIKNLKVQVGANFCFRRAPFPSCWRSRVLQLCASLVLHHAVRCTTLCARHMLRLSLSCFGSPKHPSLPLQAVQLHTVQQRLRR